MYSLVYSPKITLHNVIEIHYVKRTKTKVYGRNKQTDLPNKNLNIGSKEKNKQKNPTFSKGLDSKHCTVTGSTTSQTMMDHISIVVPEYTLLNDSTAALGSAL